MACAEDQPGVPGARQLFWEFMLIVGIAALHANTAFRMQYNLDPCGPTHILLGGNASCMSAAGNAITEHVCPLTALLHLQMEATSRARRRRPLTRHTTPPRPASPRPLPARRCAPHSRCMKWDCLCCITTYQQHSWLCVVWSLPIIHVPLLASYPCLLICLLQDLRVCSDADQSLRILAPAKAAERRAPDFP